MVDAVTQDAKAGGHASALLPVTNRGAAIIARSAAAIGFGIPVIAATIVGLIAFAALALNIGRIQDTLCGNAGFCTAQQVLFRKTQECAARAPSCGVDNCLADFRNKATLSRLIERMNEIETKANVACHAEETTSYQKAKACADQKMSANICDVAVCFTGYLSSYPGGEYIREARARIASTRQGCPATPGVSGRPAPSLPGSQAQIQPAPHAPPTLPMPAQIQPAPRAPPSLPPSAQLQPAPHAPPSLPAPAQIQPAPHAAPSLPPPAQAQPAPHAAPSLPPPAQAQPVPHATPSLPDQLQPAPGAPRSDSLTLPDGTYNAIRTFVEAKSVSDPASCPPSTPVRVTVTGTVVQFENFESNTGITRKWKGDLKPNGEISFQGADATPPTATEVTISGNYASAEVKSRFCGKGFFKITR